MSRAVSDNPAAFPHVTQRKSAGSNTIYTDVTEGMSLRDWFAGQIAGHLATQYHGNDWGRDGKEHAPIVARKAYAVADALLAARGDGQ